MSSCRQSAAAHKTVRSLLMVSTKLSSYDRAGDVGRPGRIVRIHDIDAPRRALSKMASPEFQKFTQAIRDDFTTLRRHYDGRRHRSPMPLRPLPTASDRILVPASVGFSLFCGSSVLHFGLPQYLIRLRRRCCFRFRTCGSRDCSSSMESSRCSRR